MKLRLEDLGDGNFRLLDRVRYHDARTEAHIIIDQGFCTDFASVPRALQSFAPVIGKHNRAAVIHDWLYYSRGLPGSGASDADRLTRAQCDRIFLDVMKADGVGFMLRWRMYVAVRAFGATHW